MIKHDTGIFIGKHDIAYFCSKVWYSVYFVVKHFTAYFYMVKLHKPQHPLNLP